LGITEQEMAAEVEKLADDLHQDVAKVQAWLAQDGRQEGLRESLLRRKAMTLLVDVVSGAGLATTTGPAGDSTEATPRDPA